ncbi:MAG: DUF6288 domain-containing protein [Verrucomicrobia bacterium]|nr:DUF6288 domain-containing protein [Verrucomicrobiota bacterium]
MNTRKNNGNVRGAAPWRSVSLACVMALVPAVAPGAPEYYTEPPLYGMRPNPNAETEMGPIGATGIEARIYPGVKVTVENIQPNTPAYGKLSKGDVVLGINGAMLEGKNPLVVLGTALTQAEATDGMLAFDIKPGKDGAPKQVTITIPVLGAYSKNNIGWGHWDYGFSPSYEAGGGMIHSAGNQVLLTLVMCKACGVNVDEKTLLGALKHWYRFAGHGTIPVADNRPWHVFRSGGRDGATAAVMHVASGAKGNATIYKRANEYFSMTALTSWPSREYNWEVIWDSLASPYMLEYNPDMYYQTQQRFRWSYDLYRQASGAFWFQPGHESLNATDAGISLALAFTAPLKTLHLTGAPRSKYAKDFTLPEHLWGTEADLAFLSAKPNKDFYKYGKEDEIQVPFWQLPVGLQYGPQNVKGLPLDMMLKNVRHARYEVRTAAAKALCLNQRFSELEELLRDPDPRLRRAALDGINDYHSWFLEPAVGRQALKAGEYTPAMNEAITEILRDPKEAWYVTDGALQALHHAPVELIKKNIPHILPWATHEDWWLRESAFMALMGLQEDEALFTKYLPTLTGIMAKEYNYNPHFQMIQQLRMASKKWKNDSPVGKLIIAGFARATKESKVLPDVGALPRSREGATNMVESALALIRQAPESAAGLAELLAAGGQLGVMDTTSLMKIVKNQDGDVSDRFVGLYPALATLPPEQKKIPSRTTPTGGMANFS